MIAPPRGITPRLTRSTKIMDSVSENLKHPFLARMLKALQDHGHFGPVVLAKSREDKKSPSPGAQFQRYLREEEGREYHMWRKITG